MLLERLVIYTAAELARRRRAKGLKLNHPEAVALISDEFLRAHEKAARSPNLWATVRPSLPVTDVLPGVAAMLPILQVEGMFRRRHQAGHGARTDPPARGCPCRCA